MTKLGQYLKAERERKGLTVHEIGLSLKINPKILAALEDGQKEGLPAKTFLRGFVKSYAQFLRLNVEEALSLFSEEYGPKPEVINLTLQNTQAGSSAIANEAPTTPLATISPLRKSDDKAPVPTAADKSLRIVAGVVLFLLVVFVAKMVDKYQKERELHPLQPTLTGSVETTSNPVTAGTPEENTATPPANVAADPTATPTPSESGGTAANVPPVNQPSSPQMSVAPVVVQPPKQPLPAQPPAVVPTPTPGPTPVATITPSPTPEARTNEIILETIAKVSVKYILENGAGQTLEFGPDKLHTIRAKGTIVLELSDGGAVNLIVNGRDRGTPGVAGKPLKINLPK